MVTNSHSLSPNVLQNFVLVVVVCAVLVRTSLEAVLLYAGQQGKCLVWKEGELSLHYFIIRHLASPLQREKATFICYSCLRKTVVYSIHISSQLVVYSYCR